MPEWYQETILGSITLTLVCLTSAPSTSHSAVTLRTWCSPFSGKQAVCAQQHNTAAFPANSWGNIKPPAREGIWALQLHQVISHLSTVLPFGCIQSSLGLKDAHTDTLCWWLIWCYQTSLDFFPFIWPTESLLDLRSECVPAVGKEEWNWECQRDVKKRNRGWIIQKKRKINTFVNIAVWWQL